MSVDFKKNGVATAASFGSTAAPLQEMEIKYLDDGSVWARIHYLNVANTVEWFANDAEVMKCINKNNRYSRMGIVDLFKQTDGTYEFLIMYPSISSTLYNRWSQTSSPNVTTGTGFSAITTTWSDHIGPIVFNNNELTCYSCDTPGENTWFAPIGQLAAWDAAKSMYIPSSRGDSATSTELWVRIDQLPETSICQIFDNSITATSFIEI